jgi:hypothetical protein
MPAPLMSCRDSDAAEVAERSGAGMELLITKKDRKSLAGQRTTQILYGQARQEPAQAFNATLCFASFINHE